MKEKKNTFIVILIAVVLLAAGLWMFIGTKGSPGPVLDPNKIAVSALGPDMNSVITEYFGRSQYFIIYDINKEVYWTVENPFVNEAHAAGMRVGAMLAAKGVGVIICKNIGVEPMNKFNSLGMKVYIGANGTVTDGITQYEKNQLILTTKPNVPTHYGLPGQAPCPNVPGQPSVRIDNPMNTAPPAVGTGANQVALHIYDPQWKGWTVVCQNCNTIISIPDQGLPPPSSIACPYCKTQVILELGNQPQKYFR